MNGKKFLLDTNAIVSLLEGNKALVECVEEAEWVGISIISKIEFLAFPDLPESDRELFQKFSERITVIGLNNVDGQLISKIIDIRKSYKKIKLPDAIIISTAMLNECILITADKQLHQVDEIETLSFADVTRTSVTPG
jgi:tRNA(fMet)-specific endonuclease VapC